jgi:hypothetical protein
LLVIGGTAVVHKLVPYGVLTNVTSKNSPYVQVVEETLRNLLRSFILSIEVDEDWYRAVNRDVDAAIRADQLKSGKDHYLMAGYFENRLPRRVIVDEEYYRNTYNDVDQAISRGVWRSGQEHFEEAGFKEGRIPYEDWEL